jgi:hypothetical protein
MPSLVLRPLSVGEILDRSFGLVRKRFGALAVVTLTCFAIPAVLFLQMFDVFTALALSGRQAGTSQAEVASMMQSLGSIFLLGIVMLIAASAANAGIVFIVSEGYLGRSLGAGQALRRTLPVLLGVVLLAVVQQVLFFTVGMVTMIPLAVITPAAASARNPLAGGLIGFVVFLLYVALQATIFAGLFVSLPALVLERGTNPFTALGRSWSLTRGGRLRIIGLLLVLFLIMLVVYVAVAVLGAMFTAIVGKEGNPAVGIGILLGFIAVVVILFIALVFTLQTVLYYDFRVRKEGFDLEVLASSLRPA